VTGVGALLALANLSSVSSNVAKPQQNLPAALWLHGCSQQQASANSSAAPFRTAPLPASPPLPGKFAGSPQVWFLKRAAACRLPGLKQRRATLPIHMAGHYR